MKINANRPPHPPGSGSRPGASVDEGASQKSNFDFDFDETKIFEEEFAIQYPNATGPRTIAL